MRDEGGRVNSALVLFAHGSRDPGWAAPFRAVQQRVAARQPDLAVELAFLELMQPTLPATVDTLVARGHTRVAIAPMFMSQGAHLKRDLAKLIADARASHPGVELVLLPAAGEVESVVEAMSAWLSASA